eukprot:TRINITY_DN1308_c0_g1_i1.p1 TRINITY_DN1308_c0_g1~~TRINITY_DN1308_c0_g1_i1.p1  ORF type:complete len:388 (-),score=101.28 TRINITY_DN1308_c0_g1_i1:149-1312(-)
MDMNNKKRPSSPLTSETNSPNSPSKMIKMTKIETTSNINPAQPSSLQQHHHHIIGLMQSGEHVNGGSSAANGNAGGNGAGVHPNHNEAMNAGMGLEHHSQQQQLHITVVPPMVTPVKNGRGGKREGAGRKKKNTQNGGYTTKNGAPSGEESYRGLNTFTLPNHQHPVLQHGNVPMIALSNFSQYLPGIVHHGGSPAVLQQHIPAMNSHTMGHEDEEVTTDDLFSTVLSLNQKFLKYVKTQATREASLRHMCSMLQQDKDELQSQLNDMAKQREFYEPQISSSIDQQLSTSTYSSCSRSNGGGGTKKDHEMSQQRSSVDVYTPGSDSEANNTASGYDSNSTNDKDLLDPQLQGMPSSSDSAESPSPASAPSTSSGQIHFNMSRGALKS